MSRRRVNTEGFKKRQMRMNIKTTQRRDLLGTLAEFLNLDIDRLDPEDIKKVASLSERRAAPDIKPSLVVCFLLRPEADYPDAKDRLAKLQQELKADIRSVLKPQPIPQGQFVPWPDISDVGFRLLKLVQKIDKMQLAAGRSLVPIAQLRKDIHPFAMPLEVKGETFAIVETRIDRSAREGLYRVIDGALRAGTFFQLRNCPKCEKFSLATDARGIYCSDRCRIKYNYEARVENGYFKNYMREKRKISKKNSRHNQKSANTAKRSGQNRALENFLKKARGNVNSQINIGHIVKAIGGGNSIQGWKKVNPLILRYKRGEPVRSIWQSLTPQVKKIFAAAEPTG